MELKEAYEKLGLPDGSSREEVERRYELLLRKQKGKRGIDDDFSEVTKAYKLILEHEDRKIVGSITQQKYGKYKRFAKQAEKLDHFISYYRWHLIGGIAVIAFLIYAVNAYIDHREEQARLAALPPPDLEASFMGNFYLQDENGSTDSLEAAILETMPGWQRFEADYLLLRWNTQDMVDIASQQKAVIQLATEKPDVYVTDSDTFQWMVRSGAFLPLDEYVERWGDLVPEGAARRGAVAESVPGQLEPKMGEERVYGIEITHSPLVEGWPLYADELIVGLRLDTERPEKALEWIERYLAAAKQ